MIGPLESCMTARSRIATVSWCLFDFANSSYTTLIITVAYAVYFRDVVVNAKDNRGDQLWGIANFLAMLVIALTSPVVGALADWSGWKKRFLILSTLLAVAATALMFFVGPGDIASGMLLFVLGTIGFEIGYVFYNAFLPDISTPRTIGRISGWGWAVGYAGGLLCLLACRPWVAQPLRDAAGAISTAGVEAYQTSFLIVAGFYLLFALPAFTWLRESEPQGRGVSWMESAAVGFRRVGETLSHLRRYRETAKYILASLFFTDGITTVVSFAAIYATTTIGFTNEEMVFLFLVMNVVAFPGALVAGYLADFLGARRTIILTLFLWIGVVLLGASAATKTVFWVMAFLAALGMGSTQAVGRSFMAQISPPSRESEFFGFYVLSGKFASMFGPLVFGSISRFTGSQRAAVLSLLPFFLLGLALMYSINEGRAREAALLEGKTAAP
ncbi:MAG TPA: MFS transporter [Bryobacteraceae bacterium]|nr:MFS transporter [Bryobacteraceae bacterium]